MFSRTDFIIDEEPFSIFGNDLIELNLKFIDNYDVEYYDTIISHFEQVFEGKKATATLLRLTYCQSLEALFSLLFATFQAPSFILGWFQKYDNETLRRMVAKMINGKPILNRFNRRVSSPTEMAYIIHQIFPEANRDDMIDGFGRFWSVIANEFVKDDLVEEYNSLKHGMRIIPGGSTISIGREVVFGQPANPKDMHVLGGSAYGSSIWFLEKNNKKQGFAKSAAIYQKTVNWNPEVLIKRLSLISASISNTISFLKVVNGQNTQQVKIISPSGEKPFDDVLSSGVGIQGFSWKPSYDVDYMSDNQAQINSVLELYKGDGAG